MKAFIFVFLVFFSITKICGNPLTVFTKIRSARHVDVTEVLYQDDKPADVKLFGAKGDGLNEDGDAFLKAFESSNHIYVPAGNYKISDEIAITKPVVIELAPNATIIWNNSIVNKSLFRTTKNIKIFGGGAIIGKWNLSRQGTDLVQLDRIKNNNLLCVSNDQTDSITSIIIENITFKRCLDVAINILTGKTSGASISNIKINNCKLIENFSGVTINNLDSPIYLKNISISNNLFNVTAKPLTRTSSALGGNAISILGSTKGLVIDRNKIYNVGRMSLECITAGRWDLGKIHRPFETTVTNNLLTTAFYRTYSVVGQSVLVENNNISSLPNDYIEFRGANYIFRSNTISGGGIYSRGFTYKDTTLHDLVIEGNQFYDIDGQSKTIDIDFYKNVKILNNKLFLSKKRSGDHNGIYINLCFNVLVTHNSIYVSGEFNKYPLTVVNCLKGELAENSILFKGISANQLPGVSNISGLDDFKIYKNAAVTDVQFSTSSFPLGQSQFVSPFWSYIFDGTTWIMTQGQGKSALNVPPKVPVDKGVYLIGDKGADAWTGRDGNIAVFDSSTNSYAFYQIKGARLYSKTYPFSDGNNLPVKGIKGDCYLLYSAFAFNNVSFNDNNFDSNGKIKMKEQSPKFKYYQKGNFFNTKFN